MAVLVSRVPKGMATKESRPSLELTPSHDVHEVLSSLLQLRLSIPTGVGKPNGQAITGLWAVIEEYFVMVGCRTPRNCKAIAGTGLICDSAVNYLWILPDNGLAGQKMTPFC